MNIVQVNKYDILGGAARAAYRLHQGLSCAGIRSSMYVHSKQSDDGSVKEFQPSHDLWTRIRRRWRRERIQRAFARHENARPEGLELFTDDRTPFAGRIHSQIPQADVINLHWIRGFVDVQAFFEHVSVPVVWTMHDMNAFTGGCHYDMGCKKYTSACGACPQLGSDEEKDLSRSIWVRKNDAFSQLGPEQLHIVTPSTWLAEEVRRSTLLESFPVTIIPNGLDTDCFMPRPKEAVRTALGLPDDQPVVLFVSDTVTDHRKGFSLLQEALQGLNDALLVSIGGGNPKVEDPNRHIQLGKLSSDRLLTAAYSAADIFVIPSLQDNLPNTVLESMACGTPVVGFDAGGIPDMVRPDETGLLAPVGDVRALREAIQHLLAHDDERARMGRRAREVITSEYTMERQVRRYRDLYESLIQSQASATPESVQFGRPR